MLAVHPLAVDVGLFRHHLHKAREALRGGDTSSAAARLRAGLALWRGTPLRGVVGPGPHAHRVRLEQMRPAVVDELAVSIELGCHVEAAAELTALVSRHPLRERLWELLILALHRSGHRDEALEAYRDIRRLLREELGLEPGSGLRELHAGILACGGTLTAPLTDPVTTTTPAQLPAATAHFVGRSAEITWITDRLLCPDGPALVEISGFTGMGKTALATHVARSVRHHFRDGQLFATLSRPGCPPVDPGEILAGFLAAFGIRRDRLPAAVGGRSALWRTLLTERRILGVLDDADSSEQVLPLLAAAPSSAVIVTSRRRLMDLAGLRSVALGPLTDEDALELMGRLAGRERLRAEPHAAEGIVAALRAAARRPGLRRAAGREAAGDGARGAPADPRERRLAGDARRGRPGRPAVAPLLGVTGTEARRILEALVGLHLLKAAGGGRYRFRTLVRAQVRRHALRPTGVSPRPPADDFPVAHATPTAASRAGALPLTAARACRR